jgi:hypothetical protein
MKRKTLREKVYWYLWNQPVGVSDYSKRLTNRILRLIRDEQKRKCGECQYKKNYLKSVYGGK